MELEAHSYIRTVPMKLSYEGTKRMAFELGGSMAQRPFCLVAILIGLSATLLAQSPGEIDANSLSSSLLTLPLCDQPAADCSPNSAAMPPQQGSGQSDA